MYASTLLVLVLTALASAQQHFGFQPTTHFSNFQSKPIIPVLKRTEVRDDFGQVSLAYLSGDGTAVSEHGALKRVPDGEFRGDYVLVKQGSYRYTTPEGRLVEVKYIADENGFQPQGDALPVPVVA